MKTLGPVAAKWMQDHLVHGPGDKAGEPYTLDQFQLDFLDDLYRFDPDTGKRVTTRAMLGVGKGNAKTELAAAISLFELFGPCLVGSDGKLRARRDPDIPIGAASYKQAALVFGAARTMIAPDYLDQFNIYDTRIEFADGRPGSLYRVAAAQGTNDGLRPTCFVADEVHEWVGSTGRVHLIISNGLAKRDQSLELNITTAGVDLDTPAGRLYEYGRRVQAGEVEDPGFVFHWYEPSDREFDIDNPEALRTALREANPASWVDVERLASRYEVDRVPAHEFRRYHVNQWWDATGEEWIAPDVWRELHDEDREVPAGAEVVLGFDGSWRGDATALYGVWIDPPNGKPHLFKVGVWERPVEAADEWRVPRDEVNKALHDAVSTFDVRRIVCDANRWEGEVDGWFEKYGEIVEEFAASSRSAMVNACGRFYSAVTAGDFTHDGDPTLARHLSNAVVKDTETGVYITKASKRSPLRIDAAVAAVIAWFGTFNVPEPEPEIVPMVMWV